ncbi:hypothetical protein ABZ595_34170 [Streptomyces rubradiris]
MDCSDQRRVLAARAFEAGTDPLALSVGPVVPAAIRRPGMG